MRLTNATRAAVTLFILLLSMTSWPAQAYTMLDHAVMRLELLPATSPPTTEEVTLPYNWDIRQGGVDGTAQFRIAFTSSDPDAPRALCIPRIGNTYEVRLNGKIIGAFGRAFDRHADYKKPVFLSIPAGLLQQDNELLVTVHAQSGRHGGLSPVFIGGVDEVRDFHGNILRWRITGYFFVSVASGVLAVLALLVWTRHRENLFLFYGLGEILFCLRIAEGQYNHSPLPWPTWGMFVYEAYTIGVMLILKFSLTVAECHKGILKTLCDAQIALSIPLTAAALYGDKPGLIVLLMSINTAIALLVAAAIVPTCLRSPAIEQRVLAVGFIIVIIAALRDLVVIKITPEYCGVIWTVYVWLAFGVSLAWAIAERMRKSTRELARMNQTLSTRLKEREEELRKIFDEQTSVERQQATMEERQRLMRDVHDGLGSQLIGTLQLAENADISRETVTEQLRETLDHLRLTVDALQDTQGDVASLLGALRYRLGPRLEAANIDLTWAVEPLPPIAGWTLQHSRDLQMILFDAFAKLLRHDDVTRAGLLAEEIAHPCRIRIVLRDDSRGFDSDKDDDLKKISVMKMRAQRMGATLRITSIPGDSSVEILLPG